MRFVQVYALKDVDLSAYTLVIDRRWTLSLSSLSSQQLAANTALAMTTTTAGEGDRFQNFFGSAAEAVLPGWLAGEPLLLVKDGQTVVDIVNSNIDGTSLIRRFLLRTRVASLSAAPATFDSSEWDLSDEFRGFVATNQDLPSPVPLDEFCADRSV